MARSRYTGNGNPATTPLPGQEIIDLAWNMAENVPGDGSYEDIAKWLLENYDVTPKGMEKIDGTYGQNK